MHMLLPFGLASQAAGFLSAALRRPHARQCLGQHLIDLFNRPAEIHSYLGVQWAKPLAGGWGVPKGLLSSRWVGAISNDKGTSGIGLEQIDSSITPGDIVCFKHQPAQQRQIEKPLLIGQVLRVRKITLL